MAFAKKVRRYRGWIAVAVLVVVGGVAYYIWSSPEQAEITTTYETEAASVSTISSTISGTGNVATYDTTEVYPDAGGTVLSIEVAEGDRVRAGTVLFTLDDTIAAENTAKAYSSVLQAQQSVTSASQGIVQAESSLLKAEYTLEELEERSEDPSSTVTAYELEQAEKDVESAEIGLSSAYEKKESSDASLYTANLSYDSAKAAEGDYVVTAPVDGVMWSLDIEEGESVSSSGGSNDTQSAGDSSSSGAPVTIAPSDPYVVAMAVNEVDAPALAVDQRAELEFDAIEDLVMTGKVIEVAHEASNEQGVVTYNIWISLDVPDERLMQGMSAAATIITEVAKDELVVPNAAVSSDDDDNPYVEVLDDTGTPQSVYVTTGISSTTYTVILEGLSEGDEVITQTSTSGDEEEEESSGGALMMPGMGGGGGRP